MNNPGFFIQRVEQKEGGTITLEINMRIEQARVYQIGGISFYRYAGNYPGWVCNDQPSPEFVAVVLAAREQAFPALPKITVSDVLEG